MNSFRLSAFAAALLLLVPLAVADDDTATEEAVKPVAFGDVVTGLEGEGPDGSKLALDDLKIDAKKVEAAIVELAKAHNEDKAPKLDTAFSALPGLVEDGEVDDIARDELIDSVGQRFGLIATDAMKVCPA